MTVLDSVIDGALKTSESITNFGMLAVTAAFFLVLSAILMVTCFRWFMKVINETMNTQRKTMEELVSETKSQNEKLDDISEGLRTETQLRIKTISNMAFDLAIEQTLLMIKKVKTENHIADKEATKNKIYRLVSNAHDDRNTKFDCFTYRGKKLSTYTKRTWIDNVAELVETEVYSEHSDNLMHTNIQACYANIRLDFYHAMMQ